MTAPTGLQPPASAAGANHRLQGSRRWWASPGWVVSALCWAGSLVVVASSVIHFHLWSTGYRHIPTIGPLFLAQAVLGLMVALVVSVTRQWWTALAGALFAVGTIGGLVVSVEIGLFGFRDSFSAPDAHASLLTEAAAAVILAAAAVVDVVQRHRAGDPI